MGSQSRTLSLINDGMFEGMNNHYWEGKVLLVKILELLKGPKKVHYLICSSKINTLQLDPSAYSWEGGRTSILFQNYIKEKNVERF